MQTREFAIVTAFSPIGPVAAKNVLQVVLTISGHGSTSVMQSSE